MARVSCRLCGTKCTTSLVFFHPFEEYAYQIGLPQRFGDDFETTTKYKNLAIGGDLFNCFLSSHFLK